MDRKRPSTVDSPEEARQKVRWLHKYGARVIKMCATGGMFFLGNSGGAQQMSFEEMKAIVDAAPMPGIKVAAHAHGNDGIKTAIQATTISGAKALGREAGYGLSFAT